MLNNMIVISFHSGKRRHAVEQNSYPLSTEVIDEVKVNYLGVQQLGGEKTEIEMKRPSCHFSSFFNSHQTDSWLCYP
jgi:hypothetical protein